MLEKLFTKDHFEGMTRERRRSHCLKAAGAHGNGVPIVRMSKNARERCCKETETFCHHFLHLIQFCLHSVEAEFSSVTQFH